MPNDYLVKPVPVEGGDAATAAQVNDRMDAIEAAFDILPTPTVVSGYKGFVEPILVGAPTHPNHAANAFFVFNGFTSQVRKAFEAAATAQGLVPLAEAYIPLAEGYANDAGNELSTATANEAAIAALQAQINGHYASALADANVTSAARSGAEGHRDTAEEFADEAREKAILLYVYQGAFDASEGEYPEGEFLAGDFFLVLTPGTVDEIDMAMLDQIVYDGENWVHQAFPTLPIVEA
ncbi:MAG: hypothetical protein EVA65_15615 [Oceanococcus sp.]|nr:MAG: hypothetical protein EVA65_15615 [Oceanococcus sp.]